MGSLIYSGSSRLLGSEPSKIRSHYTFLIFISIQVVCSNSDMKMALLNLSNVGTSAGFLLGLMSLLIPFSVTFAYPFNMPNNFFDLQNFQLPSSLTNPNVGVSIDNSVSLSVDPKTGQVNLAGGVSDGFGVDAGIFTKSQGNSITFTSGAGQASGSGGGSAVGNGGATGSGSIFSQVPTIPSGLSFSQAQALTNSIGKLGRGSGSAGSFVG